MSIRLILSVCAIAVALTACSKDATPPTLDIATTTSVQNSGLLEALLSRFSTATIRVHAAGSGRALEMLSDRVVDLVISHAPETETRYLADHSDWSYRKLAFNRFVIVGPATDPAAAATATDAVDAFRRIAAAGAFVSRGDGSGTHEREQRLWRLAGTTPPANRLLVSGRSMAVALRHAQEKQAYTLSDEATYWQLKPQLDLVVVFEGDKLLLNTYSVIHPQDVDTARRFSEWLTTGDGRDHIRNYRIQGRVAFEPWPLSCPAITPDALPCAE